MLVQIKRLDNALDLPLPAYATAGSAGVDLHACVDKQTILHPGDRALIGTGIRIALPHGYEAQVRPRSGLAVKYGLSIVNAPGTIDSDYRGEIRVPLINLGREPIAINRGDRIAQMVIAPIIQVSWHEVTEGDLSETERHDGGFGHTGIELDINSRSSL